MKRNLKKRQSIFPFKIIAIFLVGVLLGFLITFTILNNAYLWENSLQHISKTVSKKYTNIINFSSDGFGNTSFEYMDGQISAPSDYYVTDGTMITRYQTMGGSAPPLLVLTKNSQFLINKNTLSKSSPTDVSFDSLDLASFDNVNDDCIMIWATLGGDNDTILSNNSTFDSGWEDYAGTVTDRSEIMVDKRKAEVYTLAEKNKDIYIALLSIGDKGGTDYFFNTCNTDNKQDFISIIKSLKFRGDLSFQ